MPTRPFLLLRLLVWLVALSCPSPGFAEEADVSWLWPVAGAVPGEGVLYKPQDYIDTEFNFADLFIGAPEGAVVLAPRDGEITATNYVLTPALLSMMSFTPGEEAGHEDLAEFDRVYREEVADYMKSERGLAIDPKYISYQVGLSVGSGEMVYIGGLRPVKLFATGTKIARGDTLGRVGHVYRQVPAPSIRLSRSVRSRAADPMSVFGVPSSFLPPDAPKIDYATYRHDPAKLLEDLAVFRAALEEGHSGLYDYATERELNALFDSIAARVDEPMTSLDFMLLLLEATDAIGDSHTRLYPKRFALEDGSYAPVQFGLDGDALRIFSTLPDYRDLLGRTITRVNGRPVAELTPGVSLLGSPADGRIPSIRERNLLKVYWVLVARMLGLREGDDLVLTFADGTERRLTCERLRTDNYEPKLRRSPSAGRFEARMIADDVALLDINTFELLETDEAEIAAFVAGLADSARGHLIIDLRDNRGGDPEALNNLFALLAERPFRSEVASLVRDNDTFDLFAHTDNYSPDNRGLFPDHTERRADGWHRPDTDYPPRRPHPEIHYGGELYVLTNCFSISAATLFPALVRQQERGLIVGRETGSAYHQMNAVKFAHVVLANSGLELRMPLVKTVFERRGESDQPWGRGVIPDHIVPLALDCEGQEDRDIARVLELIREGADG